MVYSYKLISRCLRIVDWCAHTHVSRQTRQSRVFKLFTHINLYRDVCALWTDVHKHMTRQTRQSRVFKWFTHINFYRDVCALWTVDWCAHTHDKTDYAKPRLQKVCYKSNDILRCSILVSYVCYTSTQIIRFSYVSAICVTHLMTYQHVQCSYAICYASNDIFRFS
jgi:hypothetical protein